MSYFNSVFRFGVFIQLMIVIIVTVSAAWIEPPPDVTDRKVFIKEGQDFNMTWKYKIDHQQTNVLEFLFGEWSPPGYISRKCLKVDGKGQVLKAKNCEDKYGYKESLIKGIYYSNVAIYNLSRSDMKTYGIDIELGNYMSPLEDWFALHMFVKAKITEFSISSNGTVKKGGPVNITCRAVGEPEPDVIMYKDGLSIEEGKGFVMHKIDEASSRHLGEYTCIASNDRKETPDRRRNTLVVEGATQPPKSGSKACFSELWIVGILLFSRWM